MSASGTDSGSSASTTKAYGTSSYSIDNMKKAAFVDELNCVLLAHHNTVDMQPIIEYFQARVDEITKKYK